MHSASSLLLSPLIAQYILPTVVLYIVYNGDQPRETISCYKLCGTRTHNQSILFIKGRYIRKMELVRVYTKCILSQREIALYSIFSANINYSYILKCHLHFSVPPIQLTRATHKTNNVCLQHFGPRRILHFWFNFEISHSPLFSFSCTICPM